MKQTFAKIATSKATPKFISLSTFVGALTGVAMLSYNGADTLDTYDKSGEETVIEYIDMQKEKLTANATGERARLEAALKGTDEPSSYKDGDQQIIDAGEIIEDIETTLLLNPDISEDTLKSTAQDLYKTFGNQSFATIAEKSRYHDECRLDNVTDISLADTDRDTNADKVQSCMANDPSDVVPNTITALIVLWLLPFHKLPGQAYEATVMRSNRLRKWKKGEPKLGQN